MELGLFKERILRFNYTLSEEENESTISGLSKIGLKEIDINHRCYKDDKYQVDLSITKVSIDTELELRIQLIDLERNYTYFNSYRIESNDELNKLCMLNVGDFTVIGIVTTPINNTSDRMNIAQLISRNIKDFKEFKYLLMHLEFDNHINIGFCIYLLLTKNFAIDLLKECAIFIKNKLGYYGILSIDDIDNEDIKMFIEALDLFLHNKDYSTALKNMTPQSILNHILINN